MSKLKIIAIVAILAISTLIFISSKNYALATDEAWKTRCEPNGYCEMFVRLNNGTDESAARLAEFAIGFPKELETGRGVIILPLGVLVQPGIGLSIDDSASYKFEISHCTNQGCFAFIDVNDLVLEQLKKGSNANFVFYAQNTKKFKIAMPLKGFTKAYKKASKKN